MESKAVVCEIVNTISILVKEELKTILINMCKNRKKRRFWVRQWIFLYIVLIVLILFFRSAIVRPSIPFL